MAAAVLWLLGGVCAEGANVTTPAEAPAPSVHPAAQWKNVLGSNDCVLVQVYQEEDLTTRAVIDGDGMIRLPLLGLVRVGQKTPEEATTLIQQLYERDYLVNPQVSLTVIEPAKLRFTVLGQVQRPGAYEFPVNESVNLLQGIAMAGGYTRLGAPSKVTLQRVQNGRRVVVPVNAEQMSKDKKAKPLELAPEDIIIVGERIF
jgi:protein involved in polysaccharide export with SLBB domain